MLFSFPPATHNGPCPRPFLTARPSLSLRQVRTAAYAGHAAGWVAPAAPGLGLTLQRRHDAGGHGKLFSVRRFSAVVFPACGCLRRAHPPTPPPPWCPRPALLSVEDRVRVLFTVFGSRSIPRTTWPKTPHPHVTLTPHPRERPARSDVRYRYSGDVPPAGTARPTAPSFAIPTGVAQVYVDFASGSDTAAGTEAAPVRTVARGLALSRAAASPGTPRYVVLRAGIHSLGDAALSLGPADEGLVFQNYPNEEAWVSGATPLDRPSWAPYVGPSPAGPGANCSETCGEARSPCCCRPDLSVRFAVGAGRKAFRREGRHESPSAGITKRPASPSPSPSPSSSLSPSPSPSIFPSPSPSHPVRGV